MSALVFKGALHGWSRSAAQAVLCALLTLYLHNKSSAQSWDDFQLVPVDVNPSEWEGWSTNDFETNSAGITVESVFDFSVPVEVISNGVRTGIAGGLQDSDIPELVRQERLYIDSYVNDSFEDDSEFRVYNPEYANFNTNILKRTAGGGLIFNSFGSQYTEEVIDDAMSPDTNLLGQSSAVSWLSAPSLSDVQSFANSLGSGMDSVPDISILSSGDSFLSGLSPQASFFVSQVSADMILNADGGVFNQAISSIPDGSPFVWLRDGVRQACSVYAGWLNSNREVFRRFIGIACCIGYVVLCIRWWLRRVFWLFEVFTGVHSGSDDPFSGRNLPENSGDGIL